MADESTGGKGAELKELFSLAFLAARTFVGGLLMFVGVAAAVGIVAAVIGYVFGNYIVAGLAALVFSAGAIVIQWTGLIFNFFVEHLIVKYSQTLDILSIKEGVDIVWTAFRDVANIAIIGLFVFTAINIILGTKEFGDKKFIAKALIIAVLINFSLLFSKIIIDASNFTAYQFYKSAGLERSTATPGTATGIENTSTSGGIADVFLYAAGITTIGDTYDGVKALAEKNTSAALAFTLVGALLLFVMVGLFLYGSFQMMTRGILLLFLMILSPLAFASWLIPHHYLGKGWERWWETLLKTAFFAPLFMMALWASMLLLSRAAAARGGATLGQFFTDPTKTPDAWKLIIVYCFAVGLLYASIKFATSLASTITGFSLTSQGLRNALVGIPALTWRFAAAPVMRQTFGRAAYFGREALLKKGGDVRTRMGELHDLALKHEGEGKTEEAAKLRLQRDSLQKTAGRYAFAAGYADTVAKAGFNIGDSGLAKQVVKAAGISELIAGQRPKEVDVGFKQQLESKVKIGEERMKALEVSAGKRQKTYEEEAEKVFNKYKEEGSEHKKEVDAVAGAHEGAKRKKTAIEEELKAPMAAAQARLNDMQREADRAKKALAEAQEHEVEGRRTEFQAAMQNLQNAQKRLQEVHAPVEAIEQEVKQTGEALTKFREKVAQEADQAGKDKVRAMQQGNVQVAEYVGRKAAGTPEIWIDRLKRGATLGKSKGNVVEEVAGGVAKGMRAKVGTGNVREALRRIKREFGSDFKDIVDEEV